MPGSMVSVAPLLTVISPQTSIGLLVAAQVLLVKMIPLTQLLEGGALVARNRSAT